MALPIDGTKSRQNNSTRRTPMMAEGITSNHGAIFPITVGFPANPGERSSVIIRSTGCESDESRSFRHGARGSSRSPGHQLFDYVPNTSCNFFVAAAIRVIVVLV